jgi:histidinol phosphatase-like enzyme (inositol monophosphatase family)
MESYTEFTLNILAKAAVIPKQHFRELIEIANKEDDSPVTIADQNTEKLIRDAILAKYPDHAITGEEYGSTDDKSEYRWIIDPIDGTKSFITGFPLYGMLLGLLKNNEPILGAIHMPELNETYLGEHGKSSVNGERQLATSQITSVQDSRIYINEGEKIASHNPGLFTKLCKVGHTRRLSYDCYPHAMVAAGYIDVCIDYDLKPFDYLPLIPVVEGAGGVVSDWEGNPLDMNSDGRVLSCANTSLRNELVELINS